MNSSPHHILITAAGGFLGQQLSQQAEKHRLTYTASYHRTPVTNTDAPIIQTDLTSEQSIRKTLHHINPDVIINLAAINPAGPENLMDTVNAQAAAQLAKHAFQQQCRLIHVSSDCVHSGRSAPYSDDDIPTPINTYGRSKAHGEQLVMQNHPDATIIRTSLIYSLHIIDRGTAGFVEKLHHGTLALFSDVIRQPITADTLSEALLKLIDIPYAGILNIAGAQPLSRFEFGQRMLDFWHIDYGSNLTTAKAAQRVPDMPLDLRLHTKKAQQLLNMSFPGVDESIRNFQTA